MLLLFVLTWLALPLLAPGVQIAGITAIASTVAVGASILTARSASSANAQVANTTSRTDIEKGAFERAEAYYQGVIEDQDRREQHRLGELREARAAAEEANHRAARCEQAAQHLEEELAKYRMTARRLVRLIAATDLGEQHPDVHEAILSFIADQQVDPPLPAD